MDGAEPITPARSRFVRIAWAVLGYNVLVMAWGAYVRATFSGDGCVSPWPLCNGEIVFPTATKALVESSHRGTSGIAMIAVYVLAILAFRTFPKRAAVRRAAVASAVFVSGEALIGAFIVLFRYVAHDKSLERAFSMSAHLTNTFLLLGALALTAYHGAGGAPAAFRGRGWRAGLALAALGSMIAVGMTGALAALGDTLFPAHSVMEGLTQDLSLKSDVLLKLRTAHPFVAVTSAVLLLAFASYAPGDGASSRVRGLSRAVSVGVFLQLALGALNVALLAPVAVQMAHLILADAVWVLLVILVWSVHAADAPSSARQVEPLAKLQQ